MKITNQYNLPQPLVDAIKNDTYQKRGDISVTKLIDSPRVSKLYKEHYKDIQEDAIDMVWALFGTSVHSVIERASEGNKEYLSEFQVSTDILGWELTGTADLYDTKTKTLYDFKVTSAWKAMASEPDAHWQWEAQMNVYAHILRNKYDMPVENIRIIAILKDWNKREAERNFQTGKYPQKQVAEIALPVYSDKAMAKYIAKRIKLHQDVLSGKIDYECSAKETWSRPDKFALMKVGGKRAKKVYDSEKDANEALTIEGTDTHYVEHRPGESIRCAQYCAVNEWCEQYKNSK